MEQAGAREDDGNEFEGLIAHMSLTSLAHSDASLRAPSSPLASEESLQQPFTSNESGRTGGSASQGRLFALAEVARRKRERAVAIADAAARAAARPSLNARSLAIAESMPLASVQRLYHRRGSTGQPVSFASTSPPADLAALALEGVIFPEAPALAPPRRRRSVSSVVSGRELLREGRIALTPMQSDPERDAEATFSPRIVKRSVVLAARRNPGGVPFGDRLHETALLHAARQGDAAARAASAELAECTFAPRLLTGAGHAPPSSAGSQGTSLGGAGRRGSMMLVRQTAWLAAHKAKVERMRAAAAAAAVEGCTFVPSLVESSRRRRASIAETRGVATTNGTLIATRQSRTRSASPPLRAAAGSTSPVLGSSAHLARLAKARAVAAEQRAAVAALGRPRAVARATAAAATAAVAAATSLPASQAPPKPSSVATAAAAAGTYYSPLRRSAPSTRPSAAPTAAAPTATAPPPALTSTRAGGAVLRTAAGDDASMRHASGGSGSGAAPANGPDTAAAVLAAIRRHVASSTSSPQTQQVATRGAPAQTSSRPAVPGAQPADADAVATIESQRRLEKLRSLRAAATAARSLSSPTSPPPPPHRDDIPAPTPDAMRRLLDLAARAGGTGGPRVGVAVNAAVTSALAASKKVVESPPAGGSTVHMWPSQHQQPSGAAARLRAANAERGIGVSVMPSALLDPSRMRSLVAKSR